MERCKADILLKNSNTKKTGPRQMVLDKILASVSPVNANQLHEGLGREIDLATVYRSLKTFQEKGLVRTIRIADDSVYYEKSCEHNPLHAHFYCEECKGVQCLKPFGFEESSSFMQMAEGKKVASVELIIKGRCERCV